MLVGAISSPPLMAYKVIRGIKESDEDRAFRQSQSACCILTTDAHTGPLGSFLNGLGMHIGACPVFPMGVACHSSISELRSVCITEGVFEEVHINTLEFIATYWSLLIILKNLQHRRICGTDASPLHIHVATDNTTSLSWLRKNSHFAYLNLFLLQELSRLQWASRVLLTFGYVKGVQNFHADAASRNYVNQEEIFAQHKTCWHLQAPANWKDVILQASRMTYPIV
jgi:hypothetical protein